MLFNLEAFKQHFQQELLELMRRAGNMVQQEIQSPPVQEGGSRAGGSSGETAANEAEPSGTIRCGTLMYDALVACMQQHGEALAVK